MYGLSKGIWSHFPTKFSVFLRRLRWGFLITFRALHQWYSQAPSICLFYRDNWESVFILCLLQGDSHLKKLKSSIPIVGHGTQGSKCVRNSAAVRQVLVHNAIVPLKS